MRSILRRNAVFAAGIVLAICPTYRATAELPPPTSTVFISPEIDVLGNSLVSIQSGDTTPSSLDYTDMGQVVVGSSAGRVYDIASVGTADLELVGNPLVSISGSSDFSIFAQPAVSTIPPTGAIGAYIVFAPTSTGIKTATITILSNDADEGTYTFTIQGEGLPLLDNDHDSDPDSTDPDDDNDGALDPTEGSYGSDPFDSDTDDDGVLDGREITDRSNVLASDSYIEHGKGEYCLDWNGFLSGFAQIAEFRSTHYASVAARIELRNAIGAVVSAKNITFRSFQQQDVIVNEMAGFGPNTYGTICAIIPSNVADQLQAQLVTYSLSAQGFAFGYAAPYVNARRGAQYLGYNHYFPTQNATELDNARYAYVQISNTESTAQSGALVFYDPLGNEVRRDAVLIPGKSRRDLATHILGFNTYGMIAWIPNNLSAYFRVFLNRYYYDEAGKMIAALATPAKRPFGSSSVRTTPFDTSSKLSALELSNASGASITAKLRMFTEAGSPVNGASPLLVSIPARGTRHVVLNQYLSDGLGSVQVEGSGTDAVVLESFEYGFKPDQRLAFASSATPDTYVGNEFRTSYNNYLGGCKLRLANRGTSDVTTVVATTRFDGTAGLLPAPFVVPARGVLVVDLCEAEPGIGYGEVKLLPYTADKLVGDLVRENQDGSSEFRLPLLPR